MAQLSPFTGFTADGYRFLMELEFNNEKAFVDANRQRYYDGVRDPMRALAMELSQTALDIDPLFNTNLMGVVSRLNRDTRFSANKLPYRNHAWLCFKHRGESAYILKFSPRATATAQAYIPRIRSLWRHSARAYRPSPRRS